MPEGLYRGTVTGVDARGVSINIPRFGSTAMWISEPAPGETYVVGDGVLCGFFEGRVDKIEVVRKTIPGVGEDDVLIVDDFADRPLANAVAVNTQFLAQDRKEIWRSDGSTWTLLYGIGSTHLLVEGGGQFALPRSSNKDDTVGIGTGTLKLTYFRAQRTEEISEVEVFVGTTVAAGSPTLCRIGIWEASETGALSSLVGSTTSDAALLQGSTHEAKTKALTAPYEQVKEQYYAAGVLIVTASATPTFGGTVVGEDSEGAAGERWFGKISSQSDLPSTALAGDVVNDGSAIQFRLIP